MEARVREGAHTRAIARALAVDGETVPKSPGGPHDGVPRDYRGPSRWSSNSSTSTAPDLGSLCSFASRPADARFRAESSLSTLCSSPTSPEAHRAAWREKRGAASRRRSVIASKGNRARDAAQADASRGGARGVAASPLTPEDSLTREQRPAHSRSLQVRLTGLHHLLSGISLGSSARAIPNDRDEANLGRPRCDRDGHGACGASDILRASPRSQLRRLPGSPRHRSRRSRGSEWRYAS